MNATIVTLDAGNTLFTERLGRDEMYRRVLAAHGADAPLERVAELRESVHDAMPEIWHGHVRYSDGWFSGYMAQLLRELRCATDPEQVRTELAASFMRPEAYQLFPDTMDALEMFVERGVRLALVSNWSTHLRLILDGLGLSRFFEVLAISAEVGHTKPDARIFEHVLRALDAAPETVLHVGDHPARDVAGARRAGLSALLLDRAGEHPAGDHVVRSLKQVPERL